MSGLHDVIVVGGGHAGCEAAAAAARIGARTLLLTHQRATIGVMSCNPAIGGIGKGHLVREIDALDGLMARAADRAGIHFKLLNRSKGAAVHGPRAQADRTLYRAAIQQLLTQTPNLEIAEGAVDDVLLESDGSVCGVVCADGRVIRAAAVVLTTGTFLRGMIHVGQDRTPAGRLGEAPAAPLGARLQALQLPMGRLKTGTPPRLDRHSIDWNGLARDCGDLEPEPFSRLTSRIDTPQLCCHITATTPSTHTVIRESLHLSAVYGGGISGRGPRYCPSIEDKVVRFAERTSHQVFLEPEALPGNTGGDLIYPNGISTSLPAAVQARLIATMPGLQQARIVQAGYAIEYDYVDPRSLLPTLELKQLPRLFLAGQINGTTGYEEAAAQGILAGINAGRVAGGSDPVVIGRGTGYIGVMVDDLTTQGISEPYRMFTSRAEYRLSLRADNADLRLTPLGVAWGCVGTERATVFAADKAMIAQAMQRAALESFTPLMLLQAGIMVSADGKRRSLLDILAGSSLGGDALAQLAPWLQQLPIRVQKYLHTEARYSGYLHRQDSEIRQLAAETAIMLPQDLDYGRVGGLSSEMRERFAAARPMSFGAAQRVPGVTPSALVALLGYLRQSACG